MPFSVHVIFQPKVDENYIVLFLADILLQNWLNGFVTLVAQFFFNPKMADRGFGPPLAQSILFNFVVITQSPKQRKMKLLGVM